MSVPTRVALIISLVLCLTTGVAAYLLFPAKLLHWHVPAAIFTYLFFILCVVMNICRALGKQISLRRALSACDTGIIFAGITIITGMIWGRSAWGTAWIWEPRLTGMLLMTLIFVSWRMSATVIARHVVAERIATASLIILALPSIVFTHLATRLFGGIHPDAMPAATHSSALPGYAFVLSITCYLSLSVAFLLIHRCISKRD
ncbi:MAG: cytochrome c biogenesis protein CcsA [Proteobacteria bacterium]|jgi:heme exporter protein C|nr:cytochrome c biogenesis protein CcsA [Pseudomonadota bacterium]